MNINQIETDLSITNEAYTHLGSIAQWAKFLSIVVFVALGLSVISILSTGIMITTMNAYAVETHDALYMPGVFSWGYATFMLLTLVIYFVPTYFLYKFATNLKKALVENDTAKLTLSFHFLHRNYKFVGIVTIILLAIFILMFIVGFVGMLF